MSAWLVKTRRTPSRHGRDARVYATSGHTTTAMHKLSTPPPKKKQGFSLKNVSWLLDTRKDATMKKIARLISCLQRKEGLSNDGVGVARGTVFSGDTYGRELVSKPAISFKKSWGGYRLMAHVPHCG